jgi:hypothetical protein
MVRTTKAPQFAQPRVRLGGWCGPQHLGRHGVKQATGSQEVDVSNFNGVKHSDVQYRQKNRQLQSIIINQVIEFL